MGSTLSGRSGPTFSGSARSGSRSGSSLSGSDLTGSAGSAGSIGLGLVGHVQAHNNDVWYYRSVHFVRKDPDIAPMLRARVEYMENRLGTIEVNCRSLVKHLKEQGIPQPKAPIHSESAQTTEPV
jgi:hypothetical protein